jgi:hypothetical protein
MTTKEAIAHLQPIKRKLIRSVYHYRTVNEALITLCPEFEYPDWDYRTVGEFLRKHHGSLVDVI